MDVHNGRVVKGTNFVNLKDAGDPVEVGREYDVAGADELVFLDGVGKVRQVPQAAGDAEHKALPADAHHCGGRRVAQLGQPVNTALSRRLRVLQHPIQNTSLRAAGLGPVLVHAY